MPPRPSVALALALATVGAAACRIPLGNCGPQPLDHEPGAATFPLRADGLVEDAWRASPVDPSTDAGCEALCEQALRAYRPDHYVSVVESCTATPDTTLGDTDTD